MGPQYSLNHSSDPECCSLGLVIRLSTQENESKSERKPRERVSATYGGIDAKQQV